MIRPLTTLLTVTLIAGCSSGTREIGALDPGNGPGADDGSDGDDGSNGDDGNGDGGDDGGNDDGDDGGGIKYDVENGSGGPGDIEDGCEKIDFLFAIDNSGSMGNHQERLAAAYPAFAASILAATGVDDHRVLVVDSDENPGAACWEEGGTGSCKYGWWDGLCTHGGEDDPDDAPTCEEIEALGGCDVTFGAGVRAPWGLFANNGECGVPDDCRYLTTSDSGFADLFTCVAKVGATGECGRAADSAAVEALTVQKDDCNAGFLRDDAILIVTILSDDFEGDRMYPGDAEAPASSAQPWVDAIFGAKGGDRNAVTAVTLFGSSEVFPDFPSTFSAFNDALGDRVITGHILRDDFGTILDQAVDVIAESCEEFEPQG